jgi:hypothetical protein
MPRYRIRIANVIDRTEQVRLAYRVRENLIEHAQVWVDSEHPLQGVHRDTAGHAYLEFAAENRGTISDVLNRGPLVGFTELRETDDPLGEACQDCGNIAGPVQPPVCPNCGFRDIGPCPVCGVLHSRHDYVEVGGNLFYCPTRNNGTRHRVRLMFNDPLLRLDGKLNQPLVLVRDGSRR